MTLKRFATIDRAAAADSAAGESADLVIDMAFASEIPYERWWGVEILDCKPESVRLQRLNDGAPLLFNHDWNDLRGVHVPGTVRCDEDGVLRGQVRITAATQAGRDTIALVQGDVLTKSSVGYEIYTVIEQTTSKDGRQIERTLDGRAFERVLTRSQSGAKGDIAAFRRSLDAEFGPFERGSDQPTVYRVTDWEPLENSLVTVPADNSVGVGRTAEAEAAEPAAEPQPQEPTPPSAAPAPEPEAERAPLIQLETDMSQPNGGADPQARVKQILELGEQFAQFGGEKMAAEALKDGATYEQFNAKLMEHISKKTQNWDPQLGLSDKETRAFSLFRALDAKITGDWSKAGFERECHEALSSKASEADLKQRGGIFLPVEVRKLHAARSFRKFQAQRDLVAATPSAGGYAIAQDYFPGEFIDLLKAQSLLGSLGARFVGGLVGNWSCAKKTGAVTTYWLANESTPITESQPTLGQLLLTPKHIGAYTEISRQAMIQVTPDAEGIVYDDIFSELSLGIDRAGFNGSGASGQPTGILNTAGIGTVTGTTLGYAGIVEFQTDLATGNALADGCAYVTTPLVAGLLKQRQRFTSTDTPLWVGNLLNGTVEGFQAKSSTQIPSATMLFGNFGDVIVADWGMLELTTNPYANFAAGIVGVRGWATVDIGVRRAASFSVATSIT